MTLQNIISFLLETKEFKIGNFSAKPVGELTQQEKNDLVRDLAINIKGGYICKKCKKEFSIPSELDFHHDKYTYANLKKNDVKKYRRDTAWEIIKQSEEGRDIKLLCPSCHRKEHKEEKEIRTEHTEKKEDTEPSLFDKKEIKKYERKSEKIVFNKDKMADLFEQILTKKDFKKFKNDLIKKDPRFSLKEIYNNYLIELLNSDNGKKTFSQFIKNKKEDILDDDLNYDIEEDKLIELSKNIAKLRAILQYYHPKNKYNIFLKDKNKVKANIKNMSR